MYYSGGYADTTYIISNELTVDTAYEGDNISTSLNIGSTNIGSVFVEVVNLTISAPSVVSSRENFTVFGESYPNATVTLSYINDAGGEETVGSTIMDPAAHGIPSIMFLSFQTVITHLKLQQSAKAPQPVLQEILSLAEILRI